MKSGLGVGLTMMGIAVLVAACEHEAQREPDAANRVNAGFFESAAPRPPSRSNGDQNGEHDGSLAGHTDKFLWDEHATPEALDAGSDAGPRSE